MPKLLDVTEQNKDTIKLMNSYEPFKKILIYKMGEYNIFYCINSCGKLHISASIRNGFPTTKVMLYIFNQLTDKNIFKFKIFKTNIAFYFLEKEI